jgi:hypothetical protein
VELQEPVALMKREKPKRRKPRGDRTDKEQWGGPTRKSEEGSKWGRSKGVGSSGRMTEATGNRWTSMGATDKPFNINKKLVYELYKAVKFNGGAAGVDGQTIEQFEAGLKSNLYKIWNRMSKVPASSTL